MTLQIFFTIIAVLVIVTLVRVLRSGRIREKYAALWIVVGIAIVVLAVWPAFLDAAARLLGIQVPANLLFFMAAILLVGVTLHLSLEVSKLEDESRVLAEEVALIRSVLQRHGLEPSGDRALPPTDRGSDTL